MLASAVEVAKCSWSVNTSVRGLTAPFFLITLPGHLRLLDVVGAGGP